MGDLFVAVFLYAVVFFAGYLLGGRKRRGSSVSAGEPPTREDGTITHPTPADTDQGAMTAGELSRWSAEQAGAVYNLIDDPRPMKDLFTEKEFCDLLGVTVIHGYGVWHAEDKEWIGFGVSNGIAADLIPPGANYAHLQLRAAVAHIVNETEGEPDE